MKNDTDARLRALENSSTELRVAIARVEERIQAHAEAAERASRDTLQAIYDIKGRVEPLQKSMWKQHGGVAVIATAITALSHLLVRLFPK